MISAENPTYREAAGVDFWKKFVEHVLSPGPVARISESDGHVGEIGANLNESPLMGRLSEAPFGKSGAGGEGARRGDPSYLDAFGIYVGEDAQYLSVRGGIL